MSPISIVSCLALALHGARGETQIGILQALNGHSMLPSVFVQSAGGLTPLLQSQDPRVEFLLGNSIWSAHFSEQYKSSCASLCRAEVRAVLPTAAQINSWCARKTRGMISKVLEADPDPKGAVLVNALYFKGLWAKPFDVRETQQRLFQTMSGRQVACQMMKAKVADKSDKFSYFENDTCQMLALPYGDIGQFSAVLVLPRRDCRSTLTMDQPGALLPAWAPVRIQASTLHEALAGVRADWAGLRAQLRPVRGDARLPRFKLEYGTSLRDLLRGRGMARAFMDATQPNGAEFFGMSEPDWPMWIDDVVHRTVVEVDEEGTKAAAVTACSMMAGCAMLPPPEPVFTMQCDHPFLFLICHNGNGAIAFAGAIATI